MSLVPDLNARNPQSWVERPRVSPRPMPGSAKRTAQMPTGRRHGYAFSSAAIGVLGAVVLLDSSGAALAVKASPPTVPCAGRCQICAEMESTPTGGRCVKCGIDPSCSPNAGLSPEASEFLDAHNAYRSKHCAPDKRSFGEMRPSVRNGRGRSRAAHTVRRRSRSPASRSSPEGEARERYP